MHSAPLQLTEQSLAELATRHQLQRPALAVGEAAPPEAFRPTTVRATRPLYPASMIKIPLVAAALLLRARGALAAERTRIAPENLTQNDGPSPLVEGYEATLDELCALAIERSDNVATNQLFDVLGRTRASAVARAELGLRDTGFRRKLSGASPLLRDPDQSGRNTFPASDAATLLNLIAVRAFRGADDLYRMLAAQEWNTKLSTGLRSGDEFAHKTGDTETVSHDGGILTTGAGRTYIVVAYTGCASSDVVDARFGAFMRDLRAALV